MVLMANMQMERRRVGDCYHNNHQLNRGLLPQSKCYSNNSSPLVFQSCSFSSGGGGSSVGGCGNGGGGGGLGYIEHTVSKFDTLAGVAIKYGVEVSDIKRMNGLTTDLQMFALKTLQIPLPGRHPPSPNVSNGPTISESKPVGDRNADLFNSIKSLKLSSSSPRNLSPSTNSLLANNGVTESFEMVGYRGGSARYSYDRPRPANTSNPSIGIHRKSKSLVYGLPEKNGSPVANHKEDGSDKPSDKLVRRRNKSEIDLNNHTPPENNSATKRGLASRQKASSRTSNETEAGLQNLIPQGLKDALAVETFGGVRKSSSTPSFDDSGHTNNSSSSIWPTSMLSLTADLQALSTAAIAMPMFDGLPKPTSGRKNKAALD